MNLLSIQDIRDQLTPDFIVYKEFEAVCEGNTHAVTLLSHLFWWSQVTESKYPERNGWFYKTFKDLKRELGFTRRMVEKARHFLQEKQLIQTDCRYVFNRTHWLINKECLLQLILRSQGVAEAVGTFFNPKLSNYHFDSSNFRLEKWVNLKLWDDFITMQQEAGHKIGRKQKVKLFKQLKTLYNKNRDQNPDRIIEQAIGNGWSSFAPPPAKVQPSEKQAEKHAQNEYLKAVKQINSDVLARENKGHIQNDSSKAEKYDGIRKLLGRQIPKRE